MAFVIADNNGNFVHIGSNNKFEIVNNAYKATYFKYEKADNYLNNNMKHREDFENWSVFNVDTVDDMDLNEIRVLQEDLYKKIKSYRNRLNDDASTIDKEVVDLEHYMEFSELNAAQGYMAYKMMHDRLIKRRKIKNNMYKSEMLLSASSNDYINGIVEKEFRGYDNRQYSPRVLKELFEND